MEKLPTVKRLDIGDFPTQKDWIGGLFFVLNDFIRLCYSLFDGGLTIKDNMKGMTFTASFRVASSSPTANIVFRNTMSNIAPYAVLIGWVRENGTLASATSSIITSATHLDWYYDTSKKEIHIQNVIGLTAGKSYTMNLVVFGG